MAHLRRGVELRRAGRDDEARIEFQIAYEATHTPVAAGQLGFAEQALGQWVAAEAHVREAMTAAEAEWVLRNRAALESAYATIQQHIGQLEVRGEPAGAEVHINGVRVGTLPLGDAARVVAGDVALEVSASGFYTESRRVTVAGGSVARESVDLRRLPEPVAERRGVENGGDGIGAIHAERNQPASLASTLGIVGIATGSFVLTAGLIGTAGYFVVVNEDGCPRACVHLESDIGLQQAMEILALTGDIVGGAMLAASIVLVSLHPASPRASIGLLDGCAWNGRSFGVACGGRF